MKMIKTLCAIGVVAASFSAANVMAKVSPEETAKLGNELTPIGAEKAGNADGTIPEWTGGVEAPADYKVGEPYPDPFASDQVLFTITKDNMAQYADKLSDGQKKTLERYSTYKMKVYPTHRSVGYIDKFGEYFKHNATNAEM
ncbi:DUF1329 domain-containing protein, partial [Oleiphilus sp. HI0132]